MRDVAARAGVSAPTVSRVLGGTYPVAAATRAKAFRTMRELDYVVNAHARTLGGATDKTVAGDVTGPFCAQPRRVARRPAPGTGHACGAAGVDAAGGGRQTPGRPPGRADRPRPHAAPGQWSYARRPNRRDRAAAALLALSPKRPSRSAPAPRTTATDRTRSRGCGPACRRRPRSGTLPCPAPGCRRAPPSRDTSPATRGPGRAVVQAGAYREESNT
ncbi:LacI family DNA-binding transcriptional regulator [Streptomyces sp. NPDC051636]|uniref:LacI family DNA-binding transcriptional regulator n=1 Tax=Streptomyces sp. NPDC051636 TaxID=3365663 RepID=UPI00379AC25F